MAPAQRKAPFTKPGSGSGPPSKGNPSRALASRMLPQIGCFLTQYRDLMFLSGCKPNLRRNFAFIAVFGVAPQGHFKPGLVPAFQAGCPREEACKCSKRPPKSFQTASGPLWEPDRGLSRLQRCLEAPRPTKMLSNITTVTGKGYSTFTSLPEAVIFLIW